MISTSTTPAAGSIGPEVPGCPKRYPRYTTTNDTYVHGLYHDILGDHEVESFLGESTSYDSNHKRWSILQTLTRREALVEALYTVLSSVIRRFVKTSEPGVERELLSTQGTPECEVEDENGYPLCPILVVRAAGPSFQVPVSLQSVPASEKLSFGFPGMASFFVVKLSLDVGSTEEVMNEMETYARYILRDQPNRLYVRALALTDNHARLVHFDRAGVEITPVFDIHQHPATLVRLVTGLSSSSERVLGIDTSIGWTVLSGRKTEGLITTTGPNGQTKSYPILERIRTPRNEIRGRATTCWRVEDPDTLEELVIKDSWRPDDRPGEHELLKLLKGIPGVVQMVSYEADRRETKDFRCPSTFGAYQNRVATRVTMKSYGRSIEHFTSMPQLLCAMRDAIAGHQRLVADGVRVLHRDVAAQNVLLGRDDALEGDRGILIDFDLAFRASDTSSATRVDHNIGIRVFQSLSVLGSNHMRRQAPVHDYLDDLESFFYLLVYIFLLYQPDGTCVPSTEEGPSVLLTWNEEDADAAYTNKRGLLGAGRVKVMTSRLIEASWGPICGQLFKKFREWTLARRGDKQMLSYEGKGLEHMLSKRDENYLAVLGMFDEAIDAIQAPTTTPEPGSTSGQTTPRPPIHATNVTGISTATSRAVAAAHAMLVDESPFLSAGPDPPMSGPKLRRSVRIRNATLGKKEGYSNAPAQPRSSVAAAPVDTQPRRSARIQKRRLEEDEHAGQPLAKVRRTKKALRVPSRSR